MASCPSTSRDANGFATTAATAASLALAIIASAVVARATIDLKDARRDYHRATVEYALNGAQAAAAMTVLESRGLGRLTWSQFTPDGAFSALAEVEATKLPPQNAAELSDGLLMRLDVLDPENLRARLLRTPADPKIALGAIAGEDVSLLWKACGRSFVSPFGEATRARLDPARPPALGQAGTRFGQVWRLRVTSNDGWTDDRLVRFTGDTSHPTVVLERRFHRNHGEDKACEGLFTDAAPA